MMRTKGGDRDDEDKGGDRDDEGKGRGKTPA